MKPTDWKFSSIVLILALILGLLVALTHRASKERAFNPHSIFEEYPVIWSVGDPPAGPQVVLFRHTFRLSETITTAQLEIFADTRYEVWVDGTWVGRGPARFSQTLREYDVIPLSPLARGAHSIAVLAQWAPNLRRSESLTPMFFARIQNKSGLRTTTLVKTGVDWKAIFSDAWRADAIQVHEWGLIGPSELIDLRRLPNGWQQTDFPDRDWPNAALLGISAAASRQPIYHQRSIALLAEYRMPVSFVDGGLISPHCTMGEIFPPFPDPYPFAVQVTSPTTLKIETLSITDPFSMTVAVDGTPLKWAASPEKLLDTYQVAVPVTAGTHQVLLSEIPSGGATLCISKSGPTSAPLILEQGNNAGRRSSLAQLVSDPGQIQIDSTAAGLNLVFKRFPAYAILDAGRTIHGRLYLEIEGPADSIVDIGWDERLRTEALRPYPYLGSLYPYWSQVDSWILDGKLRKVTTIDARAGRYILIALWGPGPVRIRQLQVLEERYPLEQIGEFHSSNPRLDRIWQVGVDTLRPNLTDAFTDTPWRERAQWWGDVHAENRIAQVVFRDQTLLRRGLIFMANALQNSTAPGLAPNNQDEHIIDYVMLWVQDLAGYLRQNADQSLARRLFPRVKQVISHLAGMENRQSGLLDLPEQHWSTTAYIDVTAHQSRYGEPAAVNAIYFQTLKDASWIAEFCGDTITAQRWKRKSSRVSQTIIDTFFQPDTHSYLSNRYQGTFSEPTVHSQAWPLAYDMVPEDQRELATAVLLKLISAEPSESNIGTYGMLWVLDALGKAGDFQQALDLIQKYYGYILETGDQTWWEGFHAGIFAETSISHGWSGAPTWFLTTFILGARSDGTGGWQVRPSFLGVDHASGRLPLKNGVLDIHWRNPSCGDSTLEILAPSGTHGEAVFPITWQEFSLTLAGEPIWNQGVPAREGVFRDIQGVHVPLTGGNYSFSAKYRCDTQ